jgi:uroporphyrin-III C-methyltransferase/precorrin-2 dehydrogenase/sirohydrochlorin ferrochelatase
VNASNRSNRSNLSNDSNHSNLSNDSNDSNPSNRSNDSNLSNLSNLSNALYPAFLKLSGRRVLVVGGGPVAAGKVAGLLAVGALVEVVAPDVRPEIEATGVPIHRREFWPSDVEGAWYVIAAAPPEVNRHVLAAGEARQLFVNAVDDPDNATAYAGGVVRRSDVTIAISTAGRAPALAGLLREALDAWLPGNLDEWMAAADAARREWKAQGVAMEERRPRLLEVLNRLYERR